MLVCGSKYCAGTVLIVLTILVTGGNAQASNRCEKGWGFFSTNGFTFANGMCYLPVNTQMPVADAERYCASRMAYLIHLDTIDQFTINVGQQRITVPAFIFDNFRDFWSGMKVNEDDRLLWQTYGPRYATQFGSTRIPWNWKFGQPTSNYTGTCGSVTLGQRTAEVTGGGDNTAVQFSGQIDVGLEPCSNSLPFICEKPAMQRTVSPSNICPDGWVGNRLLNTCHRLVNETATLAGARQKCRALGGYLTLVKDTSFQSFNRSLAEITYNWFARQNAGEDGSGSGSGFGEVFVWADLPDFISDSETEKSDQCNSFRFHAEGVSLDVSLCTASFNFLCTAPILQAVDASISAKSPYFDQEELLKYPKWSPLQLSFMLDRAPKANELVFLKTPTTYLESTNEFSPPTSQNIRYTVRVSDEIDTPYYVNVTLIRILVPQRKRRQTGAIGGGDFDGNPVDFNQVVQTTGYYSLGLFQASPLRYTESEPKLVRYSESDLYIYIALVPVLEWVFENSVVDEQELVLQTLYNDRDQLREYFQDLNTVISGPGPFQPFNEVPIFESYMGIIEDFSASSSMARIRLFVSPRLSRDLPADSELGFIPILEDHLRKSLNRETFDTPGIRIRSTVSCPTRDFTDTRTDMMFTLPSTKSGEIGYSWERCYGGYGAYTKAVCEGGYEDGTSWGQIIYNTGCEKFPELNTSSSTIDLRRLSETIITDDNVNTIIPETYNLTLPELNLTSADVIYTAEILYNYWKFISEIPVNLDDVFSVLNNILQASPNEITSAQELNNAANRIILSVDELTHLFELRGISTMRFVRSFVASTVRYQSGRGDLVIGLELESSQSEQITDDSLLSVEQPADVTVSTTDTAIYLSRELVEGKPTRLSFHIYSKTELFATPDGRFKVNSKVAAARMQRAGIPILDLGENRVTVVFDTIEASEFAVCGYWNYSAMETAGGWETEGCVLRINGSKTVCECNHLTNFAVLIDLEAYTIPEAHKAILAIVTKVGLVISAVALGFTILTFLVFKHLRSGRGQQVLVNLSVAMLCSALIFLIGMDRTESVTGCKVVAALLHYFILVSFAWMLVEGILQYLRFVKVLGTYIPKFMMKSMIPAWGIPLIPVIVVLAVDHDLYYGGKGYCWLDYDAMLYAFLIPIAVVILANFIIFSIVLVNLCRRRNKGMKTNQSERKMALLHFQAGVSVFVLLGLTWVFGFMAMNEAQLVFHYLFAILNAFQGLFIFLLFTAREPQIRKAWKKLCCKKSEYKATGTGSDNNTGKRSNDTNSTSDSRTTGAQFNNPHFSS